MANRKMPDFAIMSQAPLKTPLLLPAAIAWKVCPGVIWVQVHKPKLAKNISRRKDCRLVARGILGRYLRTYEFEGKEMAWAESLVRRLGCISKEFSELEARKANPVSAGRPSQQPAAARAVRANHGEKSGN